MTYFTIEQIKQANRDAGLYFFSRDTMRLFHSRICKRVYYGKYFITSECREPGETPRLFTVRECVKGDIRSVSEFQQFFTKRQAEVWLIQHAELDKEGKR